MLQVESYRNGKLLARGVAMLPIRSLSYSFNGKTQVFNWNVDDLPKWDYLLDTATYRNGKLLVRIAGDEAVNLRSLQWKQNGKLFVFNDHNLDFEGEKPVTPPPEPVTIDKAWNTLYYNGKIVNQFSADYKDNWDFLNLFKYKNGKLLVRTYSFPNVKKAVTPDELRLTNQYFNGKIVIADAGKYDRWQETSFYRNGKLIVRNDYDHIMLVLDGVKRPLKVKTVDGLEYTEKKQLGLSKGYRNIPAYYEEG